jgi:hypothetical protein
MSGEIRRAVSLPLPQRPAAGDARAEAEPGSPAGRESPAASARSSRALSVSGPLAARPALPQARAGAAAAAAAVVAPRANPAAAAARMGQALMQSAPAQSLAGLGQQVWQAIAPDRPHARQARADLQDALGSLQRAAKAHQTALNAPGGPDREAQLDTALQHKRTAQAAAHAALKAYQTHAGGTGDRVMPVVHKMLAVGAAGAGMAFGVGRSAGVAAADAIVGAADPAAGGVIELEAARWGMGSLLGGVGNIAGEHFIKPLVNLINQQQAPVDPSAVLPDEMVHQMNTLKPGSGDDLRAKVAARQGDIAGINSAGTIHIGEAFFDGANAARAFAQNGRPLSAGATLGIGATVSALAGAGIGTTMALRGALAGQEVPDAAELAQAFENHNPDDPATHVDPGTLGHHQVPLFFVKHLDQPPAAAAAAADAAPAEEPAAAQPRPQQPNTLRVMTAAVATALRDSPVRDPAPGDNPSAPRQPASWAARGSMVTADALNTIQSTLRRGAAMAWATGTNAAVAVGTTAAAQQLSGEMAQRFVRGAGAAIGIHRAIQPWFNALAPGGAIAQGDAQMRQRRQAAVNAQAAAPAGNAAAPGAAGDAPALQQVVVDAPVQADEAPAAHEAVAVNAAAAGSADLPAHAVRPNPAYEGDAGRSPRAEDALPHQAAFPD